MGWDGGFTPEQPDALPSLQKKKEKEADAPVARPEFTPAMAN